MTSPSGIFLDASVFIAAAASRQGASALVLELCKRRLVQPLATRLVLLEAERNIVLKFSGEILIRYYRDIAEIYLHVIQPASAEQIATYSRIIHPKHAHVLAAATESGAGHLLKLDRKHFMTASLRQANLGIAIQTPGDFLRQWMSKR